MNRFIKILLIVAAITIANAVQAQHYYVVNSKGVMPNDTVMAFVPKDYSVECGRQFQAVILLWWGHRDQWVSL